MAREGVRGERYWRVVDEECVWMPIDNRSRSTSVSSWERPGVSVAGVAQQGAQTRAAYYRLFLSADLADPHL